MIENLQSIIARAKRVISNVMNIDERGIKFLRVEFDRSDLILYFTYSYRTFKVIASPSGEIKSIEEIVNIEVQSNAFCIDKKSAIVMITRRYPEWRIIDIEQSRDGYVFKLQANGKLRIVRVLCDGRIVPEYSIYRIAKKFVDIIEHVIGRKL